METHIVVRDIVGPVPYWVIDIDLPKAKARFKRLTGKFPSSKASIVAFTGTPEFIDEISVNDLGDIIYNKNLTRATIQ